jgi:hypothetical protein
MGPKLPAGGSLAHDRPRHGLDLSRHRTSFGVTKATPRRSNRPQLAPSSRPFEAATRAKRSPGTVLLPADFKAAA